MPRKERHGPPRKRGAPYAEGNGRYVHGHYSTIRRAERLAELQRQQAEAAASRPPCRLLDYEPILRELARLRRERGC